MIILLVEDEPHSMNGMKSAIEQIDLPFDLLTSDNGEQAAHMIQADRPDLIVTDIMLPDMTGLDVLEQNVGPEYRPKIIVVSGFGEFEYAQKSISLGVVDYFLKPFSTPDFIDKIRGSLLSVMEEREKARQMNEQQSYAVIGNRYMRDTYLVDFCLKPTPLKEHIYEKLRYWNMEWLANRHYTVIVYDQKEHLDGKPLTSDTEVRTFAIGNLLQELIEAYPFTILFKDPKNRWVMITGDDQAETLTNHMIRQVKTYTRIDLVAGISPRMDAFEAIHAAYNDGLKACRLHSLSIGNEASRPDRDERAAFDHFSPKRMVELIMGNEEGLLTEAVLLRCP